ncbi:MAG: tRNA (5-methylaminomethyl-2-thiouridine)(34)-methyltransferase MnmD, partial [Halieaceae bacterium]|nr:tRNA (5-methylaminomethyl-2-thiouridine)(34)-methyltransferase MnmD [Halieaceae bacterium]
MTALRRNNTPWHPVAAADLEWTTDHNPSSRQFDDIYYSRDGGSEESLHVFIKGNQLTDRWQKRPQSTFCIAELGFGTGLNFLLTWQAWQASPAPRPRLHYLAIEKHPLTKSDLERALAAWPDLAGAASTLLNHYPELIPGQHRVVLADGSLILDLWWEDVGAALPDLAQHGRKFVDAWYLDGFSPARNATMWSHPLFAEMARASKPGATFATFTAAGDVRRGLSAAGFEVDKMRGFGHKRECLRGQLKKTAIDTLPPGIPWDIPRVSSPPPTTALVIGAGIAGCTAAAALARRGVKVTVLEKGPVAGAASGNEQGILYTRLSRKHSTLTDFALQSFCFAHRYYGELFSAGQLIEDIDGALCGSFHPIGDPRKMGSIGELLHSIPEFARVVDAPQASQILGEESAEGGYWFPRSGWMRPPSTCRALLNSPCIELLEETGEVSLVSSPGSWSVSAGGKTLAQADCAVIATGADVAAIEELKWLPVQSI